MDHPMIHEGLTRWMILQQSPFPDANPLLIDGREPATFANVLRRARRLADDPDGAV